MDKEHTNQGPTEPTYESSDVNGRRRFLAGSSAAILASMASRPVLGTGGGHNCAPSGYASINLNMSGQVVTGCGGRSPDGWKPYMRDRNFQDGHIRFKDLFGHGPIGHSYDAKIRRVVLDAAAGDPACEFACCMMNARHGLIGLSEAEVRGLYECQISGTDYMTSSGVALPHQEILFFIVQTHSFV